MSNLTKEQRKDAFVTVRDILLGRTFGSDYIQNEYAYHSGIYTDYAEFKNVQFIGYGSDDVDAFLNIVMNPKFSCPPVKKIILSRFSQFYEGTKLGHNVYALAEDNAGLHYMVGGMTDYSGSGSAAYKKLQLVISFLCDLYDIEVEVRDDAGLENDLIGSLHSEVSEND